MCPTVCSFFKIVFTPKIFITFSKIIFNNYISKSVIWGFIIMVLPTGLGALRSNLSCFYLGPAMSAWKLVIHIYPKKMSCYNLMSSHNFSNPENKNLKEWLSSFNKQWHSSIARMVLDYRQVGNSHNIKLRNVISPSFPSALCRRRKPIQRGVWSTKLLHSSFSAVVCHPLMQKRKFILMDPQYLKKKNAFTHPLIKTWVFQNAFPNPNPCNSLRKRCGFFIRVSIHSPPLLSSSFPHPAQRALWASVPVSREDPGTWPRSGPGTPTRPSSALLPCSVVGRTSCGRRLSSGCTCQPSSPPPAPPPAAAPSWDPCLRLSAAPPRPLKGHQAAPLTL